MEYFSVQKKHKIRFIYNNILVLCIWFGFCWVRIPSAQKYLVVISSRSRVSLHFVYDVVLALPDKVVRLYVREILKHGCTRLRCLNCCGTSFRAWGWLAVSFCNATSWKFNRCLISDLIISELL